MIRRTLQMRLALSYSGVFFACGVILLAVVAGLVRGQSTQVAVPATDPAVIPEVSTHHGGLHTVLLATGIGLAGIVVVAFVLAVAFLVGWLIAGRALRPLDAMTTTAQAISADNMHPRIGLDSPYEELKKLGTTLDDLFGRLEAAFESQRHFVANASHELRTPLTAERALLQVTLADPEATAETLRAACEELLTLGAVQERLIDSLLTLAASEQGVEHWEPLDLGTITAQVVRVRQAEAQERDIALRVALGEAATAGHPQLVESLIANLVDNAIRHNVPGGQVDVATATTQDGAVVTVRNTGPAIPPAKVGELFVPFRRLHPERTHHPDGHGLGLTIVQAIASAHRATLTANAPDTGGLDVRVSFPLDQPNGHPAAP